MNTAYGLRPTVSTWRQTKSPGLRMARGLAGFSGCASPHGSHKQRSKPNPMRQSIRRSHVLEITVTLALCSCSERLEILLWINS